MGLFGEPFLRPTRRCASRQSLLVVGACEQLEDRTLLTNYVVTVDTDVVAADG
jgi:hypothetical protein